MKQLLSLTLTSIFISILTLIPSNAYAQDPVCEPLEEKISTLEERKSRVKLRREKIRERAYDLLVMATGEGLFDFSPYFPVTPNALHCWEDGPLQEDPETGAPFQNTKCYCDSPASCVVLKGICGTGECTGISGGQREECWGSSCQELAPIENVFETPLTREGALLTEEAQKLLILSAESGPRLSSLSARIKNWTNLFDPSVEQVPVPEPTPSDNILTDLYCDDTQDQCLCVGFPGSTACRVGNRICSLYKCQVLEIGALVCFGADCNGTGGDE